MCQIHVAQVIKNQGSV